MNAFSPERAVPLLLDLRTTTTTKHQKTRLLVNTFFFNPPPPPPRPPYTRNELYHTDTHTPVSFSPHPVLFAFAAFSPLFSPTQLQLFFPSFASSPSCC